MNKENGGLGVRLRKFNLSLLRKWCWRIHVCHDSLWYKVHVARYGLLREVVQEWCEGWIYVVAASV